MGTELERRSAKQDLLSALDPRMQDDPLGGWAGVKRAEGLHSTVFQALELAPSTIDIAQRLPARELASRAVLEDHPRIDIRVLDLPPAVAFGVFFGRRLSYPYPELEHVSIGIQERGGWIPALIAFYDLGDRVEQTVEIICKTIEGRFRPFFVCPVEQKPVEVLAFRDGLFASATAQRLVHRSQMGANRKRKSRARYAGGRTV